MAPLADEIKAWLSKASRDLLAARILIEALAAARTVWDKVLESLPDTLHPTVS